MVHPAAVDIDPFLDAMLFLWFTINTFTMLLAITCTNLYIQYWLLITNLENYCPPIRAMNLGWESLNRMLDIYYETIYTKFQIILVISGLVLTFYNWNDQIPIVLICFHLATRFIIIYIKATW